ncbi:MAG: hypothetical protein K6A81_08480 [Clostridiales bacterium]|nr:hypothetical protein [Clostridiales bacterium]
MDTGMNAPDARKIAEGLTDLPRDRYPGTHSGKAEGKEVEFYGNKALLYKFPYAGLLCDLK